MSRGVVVADLMRAQTRRLKMPGLARAFEALARQAVEEHWSHEDYLHECLSVEETSRNDSAVRHRVREARLLLARHRGPFDCAQGRLPISNL